MAEQKLKIPDFTLNETLAKYRKYLEYLKKFDLAQEAYYTVKSLPMFLQEIPRFFEDYPYLAAEYDKIISSAKIIALPFLPDDQVEEIIKKRLIEAFKQLGFDILWEKIEAKLVSFYLHEERDIYKNKLKIALENSEEQIGNSDIEINEKNVSPTLANWLKEYRINLGEKENDAFNIASFINDNKNIKKLEEKNRDLLKAVYNLYALLNLSSTTAEGLEEKVTFIDEQGVKRVLNKGYLEKIEITPDIERDLEIAKKIRESVLGVKEPPALGKNNEIKEAKFAPLPNKKEIVPLQSSQQEEVSPPSVEQNKLRANLDQKYRENEPLLKQIHAEESKIVAASKGEFEKLKNYFFEAYGNKEPNVAAASLLILARTGKLKNIISDQFVQEIFEKEIFPILIKQKSGIDPQILANDFRQNKEDSIYLKIFLKFVLSRIMPQGDQSAYIGWQLENIFRALGQVSYLGLVYYNIGTSQVEWAMVNVNDDGSLVMG